MSKIIPVIKTAAFDAPGEAGADNALDDHGLVEANLASRIANGQATADARTGRAAIHLALGKDTDVAATRPFAQWKDSLWGAQAPQGTHCYDASVCWLRAQAVTQGRSNRRRRVWRLALPR